MKVTDAMVKAAVDKAIELGWELDDQLLWDAQTIVEAALAAAPPSGKRARALLSRAKWADEARRNARKERE